MANPGICCVGLNHEVAPVGVRERLALKGDLLSDAIRELRQSGGMREIVILSTCNRVEFYFLAETQMSAAVDAVVRFISQRCGMGETDCRELLYQHADAEAVTHLFEVASGMNSLVIGEPQITGQVKDAFRIATNERSVDGVFNRLFHKSFSVAKRVRTETELSSRAVSVSYVAVELAKKIFDDLSARTVLLAGAGEMATLAAQHLVKSGAGRIFVASRSFDNAKALAATFRGEPIPFESVPDYLAETDILICSTAAPDYILKEEQVRQVLRRRKHRPIFMIDIAVPRNLDPAIHSLENVYLYDIDDLKRVLESNLAERKKELKKAERIVSQETDAFVSWLNNLDLVPTIASLRERAEQIRKQEVDKAMGKLHDSLDERQIKTIEAMSQAIVNKILHSPIAQLRQPAEKEDAKMLSETVQRLFCLRPHEG